MKLCRLFLKSCILGIQLFLCLESFATSKNCKEAWGNKNIYKYDLSKDYRGSAKFKGNFGYQNFLNRVERASGLNRQDCEKDWTILVYVSARNDLSAYAFWDLYEMESPFLSVPSGSSIKADLLVEVHTEKNQDTRRLHMLDASPKEFSRHLGREDFKEFSFQDVYSPVVYHSPKIEKSQEQRLEAFIKWGVKKYPSKNYMVVVWGHGLGWDSLGLRDPDSGARGDFGRLGFESGNSSYLTTPALAKVLKSVKEDTGKIIDVYASDSCLMQSLEVAYELSEETRYIIGSSQVQSYLGFPYRSLMYELNSGSFDKKQKSKYKASCGSDQACVMAGLMPDLAHKSFGELGLQQVGDPEAEKNFTLSSIHSEGLNTLGSNILSDFNNLMFEFSEKLNSSGLLNLDMLQDRVEFSEIIQTHLRFYGSSVELGSLLGLLENYAAVRSDDLFFAQSKVKIRSIREGLSSILVNWRYGLSYEDQGFHLLGFVGVSIWLPVSQQNFDFRSRDFANSKLIQKIELESELKWLGWLRPFLLN